MYRRAVGSNRNYTGSKVLAEIGAAFGYNQKPSYRGFTTSSAAFSVLRYNKKTRYIPGFIFFKYFK